jgi:tetratricopeptide (TPR) repeat protein
MAGLTAAALAAPVVKENLWPSSVVRLAILPPVMEGPPADTSLIQGFVSDVWYRLKTLRGARRPLVVFSLTEAASEGVNTATKALNVGATHTIATTFRGNGAGWSITAELLVGHRSLGKLKRDSASAGLAGLLFAFQSEVVRMTTDALALRVEPKAALLPAEAYGDYLNGLHYARVDYEQAARAIPFFERVIAAAPGSALGYAGLAEALLGASKRSGDKSLDGRAITALAKAEQLDPELAPVRLMAGRLSAAAGFYERALADCQRAAELAPNDSEAFISMGYLLFLLKRPQESEAAFLAAFRAEPGYYKPYLDAGLLYYELRNFAAAERHWLEAVRLAPGQTRARLNLAAIYLNTGRLAEAKAAAQEILKIRRTSGALELIGDLQERDGMLAEAAGSYEEAAKMNPVAYKIWGSLATVYGRLHRTADAADAYRSGLQVAEDGLPVDPRDTERVAWCAYYHARLGETAAARSRAAEALSMGSLQGNVRKRLVLTYGWTHDINEALRLLQGTPADLARELSNSPELSPGLRTDPGFERLTH